MKYRGHLDTWQNLRREVEFKVSEYFSGLTTVFVNVTNAKAPTAINAVNTNNSRLKTLNTRLRLRMTKIERFEDIEAWKKSRELVKGIYQVTNNSDFLKDWSLKDQIRRAAASTMSNISEGFSRQTDQEFIQFLYIAKGSISEVQSQLYIAKDLDYIKQEKFTKIYDQADEIARLVSVLIRYLKSVE